MGVGRKGTTCSDPSPPGALGAQAEMWGLRARWGLSPLCLFEVALALEVPGGWGIRLGLPSGSQCDSIGEPPWFHRCGVLPLNHCSDPFSCLQGSSGDGKTSRLQVCGVLPREGPEGPAREGHAGPAHGCLPARCLLSAVYQPLSWASCHCLTPASPSTLLVRVLPPGACTSSTRAD